MPGSFDKFLRRILWGAAGGEGGCLESATGVVNSLDALVLTVVVWILGLNEAKVDQPVSPYMARSRI